MVQLKWQLIFLAILFYQQNVQVESVPMKRIVNGFNATAKQFPYQIFFSRNTRLGWSETCGGTVISKWLIVTAAHCVDLEFQSLYIILGATNKDIVEVPGQQHLVVDRKNVVIHPEWGPDQNLNDIALIRLSAALNFNQFIGPAELPDPNESYDNVNAVLSGWGATSVPSTGTSSIMKYYNVSILPLNECTDLLGTYSSAIFVPESFICLSPSSSSPCFGDSGGPLVLDNPDGSHTLLGVTSFITDRSCSLYKPAVYTRVSSYLSWIEKYNCEIE